MSNRFGAGDPGRGGAAIFSPRRECLSQPRLATPSRNWINALAKGGQIDLVRAYSACNSCGSFKGGGLS